jgi:hypothetical protein
VRTIELARIVADELNGVDELLDSGVFRRGELPLHYV